MNRTVRRQLLHQAEADEQTSLLQQARSWAKDAIKKGASQNLLMGEECKALPKEQQKWLKNWLERSGITTSITMEVESMIQQLEQAKVDPLNQREQTEDAWISSKVMVHLEEQQQRLGAWYDQNINLTGYGCPHHCHDAITCIHDLCRLFALNKDKFIDPGFERPVQWNVLQELVEEFATNELKPYLLASVTKKAFDPTEWVAEPPCVGFSVDQREPKVDANTMLTHLCIMQNLVSGFIESCEKEQLRMTCPILIIPKPNGALRMIFDARMANKWWKPVQFVLPDHFSAMMLKGTWFVKTDCHSAYMRWPVSDLIKEMCGIYDRATGKYYRWKVMAWGTNTAPFVQQELMVLLSRWLEKQCPQVESIVYLDDFIVAGKNKDETLVGLHQLVGKMEEIGVKINLKKTQVVPSQEIEWLGLLLKNHSLRITDKKRAAIIHTWCSFCRNPRLSVYADLCGKATFLARVATGLRSKIRRLQSCIPQELLRNPVGVVCDFRSIKKEWIKVLKFFLQTDPVLSIQRNRVSLEIFCDAAGETQNLGFSNRNRTKQLTIDPFEHPKWLEWVKVTRDMLVEEGERKWSVMITVLEAFAIFVAVEMCESNVNLLVYSDNQVAIAALAKRHCNNPIVRTIASKTWTAALSKGVLLLVQYIRSEENPADAPSRRSLKSTPSERTRWEGYEEVDTYSTFGLTTVANFFRQKYPHIQYVEQLEQWQMQLLSKNKDVIAYTEHKRDILETWSSMEACLRYKVAVAACKLRYMQPSQAPDNIDVQIALQCLAEHWIDETLWVCLTNGKPQGHRMAQMLFGKNPELGKLRAPPLSYHRQMIDESVLQQKKRRDGKVVWVLKLLPGRSAEKLLIPYNETITDQDNYLGQEVSAKPMTEKNQPQKFGQFKLNQQILHWEISDSPNNNAPMIKTKSDGVQEGEEVSIRHDVDVRLTDEDVASEPSVMNEAVDLDYVTVRGHWVLGNSSARRQLQSEFDDEKAGSASDDSNDTA